MPRDGITVLVATGLHRPNDEAHPWPISEEVAKLLPVCDFIPEWKTGAALEAARPRVKEFLAKHTPTKA